MNSYTRKHHPQENNGAGQSLLSAPKPRAVPGKGNDVEKPFPSKPVCHKKLTSSNTQELDVQNKCVSKKQEEHVPNSTTLNKESSRRLPAAEAQMNRVIQEKQLMLQKKLWKVEDALRQKIQNDNVGVHMKCNSTGEDEYYVRQTMVIPNTKTKQATQVTGSEVLIESTKNTKQHKFRQDTITKKHEPQDAKWDNVPAEKAVSMRKEDGRATYVYKKPTNIQQKANDMFAEGDNNNAAGRSVHEELALLQVSSNPPWELEHAEGGDTNIQLRPCHICNRNFLPDRVEKHMQICEKATKSKRPVFNSYAHRTKGASVEEYWKTHTRSRTPEVPRKKKQIRITIHEVE